MRQHTIILLSSLCLLTGCVSLAIEQLSERDLANASALNDEARENPGPGAERACEANDRLLALARSIEAIAEADRDDLRDEQVQTCLAAGDQRGRALTMLQTDCGCRRTRVRGILAESEDSDDPDSDEYYETYDGFASSGARKGVRKKIKKTGEKWFKRSYPILPFLAGSRDTDSVFKSSSIRPDWEYDNLVDSGACEPDDDVDRRMCQTLLTQIGELNLLLRECDAADPLAERRSGARSGERQLSIEQPLPWYVREFAREVIDTESLCRQYREQGLIPPRPEASVYPDYDQDPTAFEDYTPPGDDIPPPDDDGGT